jgi:hypothetical protein
MGGATLLPDAVGPLATRLTQAEAAYDAGRYGEAERQFNELAEAYQRLIPRLIERGEAAVVTAQGAMSERRVAARRAGADERAADRLAAADALRDQAFVSEENRRYAEAMDLYNRAGEAYSQIERDLSEPAAGGTTTEDQIAARVEEFRVLFESEDLARIGTELYGGDVPGEDARLMNYVFGSAEDIKAVSTIERIEAEGSSARADIRLDLDFRNERTGQRGDLELKLRLDFESGPQGWRLTRVRNR